MSSHRGSTPDENSRRSPVSTLFSLDRASSWLFLGALGWVVVMGEYLLNALSNPGVRWSGQGVAAHMAFDLLLTVPLLALAIMGAGRLARRWGWRNPANESRQDPSILLGTVGLVALLFMLLSVPVTSSRDLAHEWLGTTYGLSLAEVEKSVVTSDLTVKESTQLCSFSSLRDPSLVRGDRPWVAQATLWRLRVLDGLRSTLMQMALLLPLLLFVAWLTARKRRIPLQRAPWKETAQALRRTLHPLRLAVIGATAFILFLVGYGSQERGMSTAEASFDTAGGAPPNACLDGGPVKEYDVHAIDVTITLNRWGDHVEDAFMYALEDNIPALRAFEDALDADREEGEGLDVARVSHGLRQDLIQPLVLRANLGDCLRINFTNALTDGQPASMHILGLPHTAINASSAVGNNPDTFAVPGDTVTYEIPVPDDVDAERGYYFHDHGAGRRRQNMGLFGAIVAEPKGATYLDVETGELLDTATGSNWEAIIVDPNVDGRSDGKSFREFVLLYHEVGDEAFTDIRDFEDKKLPLIDDVADVYRPAARAINYRSEPFRRRLEVEETGKSLGYASYPFGDPATPIPRSYVGEGVKTRLLHGGSEVFHVHHLHGGGDRWRRNPNADPNNDFWKGLTKVPDPNLTSIHLDSQSIGPGTSYNLEHECGAGGCQQGVGDFLFHCHIGHHYISGMWSFWRVFGTEQTETTNLYGRPLAVVPGLFQNPTNPLIPPSVPEEGSSAGDLIGLTVDDGRMIVADADVRDRLSEVGVLEWIAHQLPPRGVPFDKFDATVWNWTHTGAGASLKILGEPESNEPFAGYVSDQPGARPEVLFNPKNGRYTWPLFRPHKAQRPPFTARHSGAPWLGEEMKEGRLDGLCAVNGVDPSVNVGPTSVKRFYPVSSITLPIEVAPGKSDPDGQIFVLNEEEQDVRNGVRPAEPLAIRSNVGDCVEIFFTNKIPDGPLNKDFSKTNIHSHFVQFDTQASDGVITGMSYEQSVRPIESEQRFLTSLARAGDTSISVNHTDRLRVGIWIGIGLGEGTCGFDRQGQPERCSEIRKIVDIPDPNTIVLDLPVHKPHAENEAVGVEFVRYNWYPDVDFGTVFFHTHVEFKDWDHGLFGAHIVEPKGSTYHHPTTGDEVRSGTLVDIRVDPSAGGNPVAHNIDGSFREFMLFLHNNNPVEGQFVRGGGTINLRAEPWSERTGEAAYRFSSVTHGDPHTQEIRAYLGDPLVVRGVGLVERVGGIRFTGHRFHQERYTANSDTRDATFIGISERFDFSLEGGAGGPGGYPGDYLYYSTLGKDFESGAWGLLRVHDTEQEGLQPLPGRLPPTGSGFPQLVTTGDSPPFLDDGPGDACPGEAPLREYFLQADSAGIVYNSSSAIDMAGMVYRLQGDDSDFAATPVVVRANAGDCLRVHLSNRQAQHASISIGEMIFDPQRSYGAAIGYNYDSTIAPGSSRTYDYFADRELGLVLALNLGNVDSIVRGAFAGVVIEPEGSTYSRPGRAETLPAGGAGIQADITTDGVTSREFVALFSDEDRRIGQNAMPYPQAVERFAGINYTHEPLFLRDMNNRPSDVFKSNVWGDPRHVVTVPQGTPLIYRVGQPWGNQMHVPTLEGHRWWQEPGMPGSEQVFNDVLAPGMSLDLYMVGGAGGSIQAPGDFLFLDRRQPFLEYGLWNILRVTDDGTSGGDDVVTIHRAEAGDEGSGIMLRVLGTNSMRPAGDFVSVVTLYEGPRDQAGCTGPALATTEVDSGNGEWTVLQPMSNVPTEVCVMSQAGGVAALAVSGI